MAGTISAVAGGRHSRRDAEQAASSGDRALVEAIGEARRQSGAHYLYEATVGAGLPVVQTLRELRETGDEVRRVEGILSGTLSYLFNVWDGRQPFSSVLLDARRQGFTEPDPRDDLSGMDVGRKLIILAREMGLAMEGSSTESRRQHGRRSTHARRSVVIRRPAIRYRSPVSWSWPAPAHPCARPRLEGEHRASPTAGWRSTSPAVSPADSRLAATRSYIEQAVNRAFRTASARASVR